MNQSENFSTLVAPVAGGASKNFLGTELKATGFEVSLTIFADGAGSGFVHSHKRNEELYVVVKGEGLFHIDGQEFPIGPGSLVRVAPAGKRAIRAAPGGELVYYCIQVDSGSLKQATGDDGVKLPDKASWM